MVVLAVAGAIPSIPWQLVAYGRQIATTDYGAHMVYFGEGMNSSVAVSETPGGARFFHVSGKTEASSLHKDMRLQRMLGHIPALLHPNPRSVLIVGCGPAGLVLAAQLAEFPAIATRIVERKPGPLQLGQADGVACRTVEMFEAFGFSEALVAEAYWVNETVFWRPDSDDRARIVRFARFKVGEAA